eukprot:TRINITY_DN7782_c0_g1_i2.p1 TRINITY_DN7782_c0_g1~~TRINITY_DN7782_c0_g1_i2.p1  ORF type:complete len:173 (-),score=9.93 TRINITY_DN7782_c0_g1_i2:242-760(-)
MASLNPTVLQVDEANPSQIEHIKTLFIEYSNYVGELLNLDLSYQSLQAEIASLPGKYGADQSGCMFLAYSANGDLLGCVALRKSFESRGEIKRLFVRSAARGQNLGMKLMLSIMRQAKSMGYSHVRLDTVARLTSANQLYQRLGFYSIPQYIDNPFDDGLFFEYDLSQLSDS